MKQCPQCGREYDNTMSFCLDDGSELLYGPASTDEPATAILHSTDAPGEAVTRAHINATDQTAILPARIVPPSSSAEYLVQQIKGHKKSAATILALAVLALCGGSYWFFGNRAETVGQISSIAVMPFQNKSGDADADYLSDGLSESLIFRLSQIPGLKVSPVSSVVRYKGKEFDAAKIATELGVGAVMSGRMTQRGDNLTISIELIDAANNKIIWGEKYDRKLSELLATQREIATTITQKLQLKLAGAETQGITKKYTDNNEAYQLYLRGRFHYTKRTKEDLLRSIDFFNQATALDPTFALAYVGVADSYTVLAASAYVPPKDVIPQAKTAAQRALEIDPTLAEAHAAVASFYALFDWNWPGAESEFRRSLELNPNVAEIHYRYAVGYLLPTGHIDGAISEIQRALELEPFSLAMGANLAAAYLYAGQRERGLEQAQKIYNLGPDHPVAGAWLGIAYNVNGMYSEAIALGAKLPANNPAALWILGYAYARSGRRSDADSILKKFKDLERTQYFSTTFIAGIYAALGDHDKAFAELETGVANRDALLPRLRIDPFLVSLRDDPRFKDLLRRLNMPE